MGAVQDSADAWDTLENVYVPAANEGTLPMRLMAMVPLPTWSASKCQCLLLVVTTAMTILMLILQE